MPSTNINPNYIQLGNTGPQGPGGPQGSRGSTGHIGPQGPAGPVGPKGSGGQVTINDTITLPPDSSGNAVDASLVNTSTNVNIANLTFKIPQGSVGPRGEKGDTGTIVIDSTVTGNPGTYALVENLNTGSDSDSSANLKFTIPRGDVGHTPEISIGTVTTGAPGSSAAVTSNGDVSYPVFSFDIPKGDTGSIQANYYDNSSNSTFTVNPSNGNTFIGGSLTVSGDIFPANNGDTALGYSNNGFENLHIIAGGYVQFNESTDNSYIQIRHDISHNSLSIINNLDTSYQLYFDNSYASIGKANGSDNRLVLTSSGEDFILPAADGANTEVLTTDGNGILSWNAPGGASSVVISTVNNDQSYNLVFTLGSGTKTLSIDTGNNILYNPSTNLLTVSGLYATGDVSVNENITGGSFTGGDISGGAIIGTSLTTSGDISGNTIYASTSFNGNIEKTSGNLDISAGDISLNATNNIQMNNGRSKIKFNNSNGDIEIDVSQNIVIAPQNGIIDLSGHTFAKNNMIQQGMIIDYVVGSDTSHNLTTNDILFGFTHICSSSSAMTITVPSLSDVKSYVNSTTGISSLSAGTAFPLSYIVNNNNKIIDVSTNDTSIIIYNGSIGGYTNATFTYVITQNDASAAIIIT